MLIQDLKPRTLSRQRVSEIIATSSFEGTDLTQYFDCPLPNYTGMPEDDKGKFMKHSLIFRMGSDCEVCIAGKFPL